MKLFKIRIFVCKTANMPTCDIHHYKGCQGLRDWDYDDIACLLSLTLGHGLGRSRPCEPIWRAPVVTDLFGVFYQCGIP
jgi:hypothetical protein